jgi:hypothetical protein
VNYCSVISSKRPWELTSCKIPNIVELMEVETAPVHNVIAFFSEGIVALLVFSRAQLAAAVDVALLKPSERNSISLY